MYACPREMEEEKSNDTRISRSGRLPGDGCIRMRVADGCDLALRSVSGVLVAVFKASWVPASYRIDFIFGVGLE